MTDRLFRPLAALLVLAMALFAAPSMAAVDMEFHSFNGSVLFGRYPHAFVVFKGTLDDTGEVIDENWGFSARTSSLAALSGEPVEAMMLTEKPDMIAHTNTHFTIALTDAQYRRIKAEVIAWRDHGGKFYDLDTNNCIHFVGRLGELAGLKVDYPHKLLKKPKAWLNHITELNPQLHAAKVG